MARRRAISVRAALAIPLTGAMKVIFDRVDSMKPYADWLGE
jgi:hypothetical protein